MSESPTVQPTNRQVAAETHFQKVCAQAGVNPTKRQASKFRRHMGRAWAQHVANTRQQKEGK